VFALSGDGEPPGTHRRKATRTRSRISEQRRTRAIACGFVDTRASLWMTASDRGQQRLNTKLFRSELSPHSKRVSDFLTMIGCCCLRKSRRTCFNDYRALLQKDVQVESIEIKSARIAANIAKLRDRTPRRTKIPPGRTPTVTVKAAEFGRRSGSAFGFCGQAVDGLRFCAGRHIRRGSG
jgi:hypothetical protein